jgi:hypothetical protein
VGAFAVMLAAHEAIDVDGRAGTAVVAAGAGLAGGAAYLGLYRVLGGSLGDVGIGALRG